MFYSYKKFDFIFVTGPHRSGTTICSKMIAFDTGHDLVLEDEFSCSNLVQLSAFLQCDSGPKVIQCPFLAPTIHDLEFLLDVNMDDVLVVFMHRYRPDIIESENSAISSVGKVDFNKVAMTQKAAYNTKKPSHISDIKYQAWQDQCCVIPNALDVGYESLKEHCLWVSDHKKLPFQHSVMSVIPPKEYIDGIRALSNI